MSGSGELVCNEPLVDELFGLRIQNSLRIARTVEIRKYEAKAKEFPLQSLPCDRNEDLKDENEIDPDLADKMNYELKWREIKAEDIY